MDEVLQFLEVRGGQGDMISVAEVAMALSLSLMCLIAVSIVYRSTHRSPSYSQSFVQTLVLTGLVTTLIMIVIGSNIARAFSLIGALSIIRFRNAVKETRDVGFIFFSMAIAMACGTRFYVIAILATAVISVVLVLMHFFDFGANRTPPERLLSVQMPPGVDPEAALQPTLRRLFDSFSIVSMESVRQGLYREIVLSVRPKSRVSGAEVLESIAEVNDNLKVVYNYADRTDEL